MKTDNKRLVIGIPCVGGKSKLADVICTIIENECTRSDIHRYVSACGGGGKDIFSLSHLNFDELVYNEYEFGMYALVKALNEYSVHEVFEAVYSKLSSSDISDKDSAEVRKAKYEALFKGTTDEVNRYSKADLNDKDTCINVAACQVILIFGSHQNNRISVNASKLESVIKQHSYAGVLHDVWFRAKDLTSVTCEDCIEVVKNAEDNTFVYIDPPYWGTKNDYKTAFNTKDHLRLIDACIKASEERKNLKIMISMHEFSHSPYTLKLYELEQAGKWHMYSFDPIKHDTYGNKFMNEFNKNADIWVLYLKLGGIPHGFNDFYKACKKVSKSFISSNSPKTIIEKYKMGRFFLADRVDKSWHIHSLSSDYSAEDELEEFKELFIMIHKSIDETLMTLFSPIFFSDSDAMDKIYTLSKELSLAESKGAYTTKINLLKKQLKETKECILRWVDEKSVNECVWCNFKIEHDPNVHEATINEGYDEYSDFMTVHCVRIKNPSPDEKPTHYILNREDYPELYVPEIYLGNEAHKFLKFICKEEGEKPKGPNEKRKLLKKYLGTSATMKSSIQSMLEYEKSVAEFDKEYYKKKNKS